MNTDLKSHIKVVPDFPIPGVSFKDINPLINRPQLFEKVVSSLCEYYYTMEFNTILVPEARGFLLGAPVAYALSVPLILARKEGKLPGDLLNCNYEKEYGFDKLYIQKGVLIEKSKVLIMDDVLATGNTAKALSSLVTQSGATLAGYVFLVELLQLNGRQNLEREKVHSLIKYED